MIQKKFSYDYLAVAFLYLASGTFLFYSSQIKEPDSRVFPLFVSSLAVALATLILLRTLFGWGKRPEYDFTGTKRAMVMTLSLLCYITAIAIVGFYLATPVYLYITMLLLGQRSQKTLLLVSVLATASVFVVFDLLFAMPIPKGMLFTGLLR